MTTKLARDIREFLLRVIDSMEDKMVAAEAETLLRRMEEKPTREIQDRIDLHSRLDATLHCLDYDPELGACGRCAACWNSRYE